MCDSKQSAVVLHVVDAAEDIARAASTAGMLQESFPEIRVTIVVNGPALEGLASFDMTVVPEGAGVAACSVGLRRRSIDEATLPEGVQVVPTAPEVIVRQQFEGAAYIRL